MKARPGWDLMMEGRFADALLAFQRKGKEMDRFAKAGSAIAYVALGRYEDAKEIFDESLDLRPTSSDSHVWSGLARWLLKHWEDATKIWERGLTCQYQDGAGGMELALLLYYAGTRRPNVYDVGKAKALIEKKLGSLWAKNWPGPVGEYIVARISEKELKSRARFTHKIVTAKQMCQADFYIGIAAIRDGKERTAKKHFRLATGSLLSVNICERYLAIHELSG